MNINEIDAFSNNIIETMAEGLMIVSPKGKIVKVNQSFAEMTGYKKEEVLNKSCAVLNCDVCDSNLIKKTGFWCRLFSLKQVVKKKCMIRKKDGTYVETIKNATMLKDHNGKIIGAVEILTDVSEINRLDRQIFELSKSLDPDGFYGMIGQAPKMKLLYTLIRKAAMSHAPIIIVGESGTGKELVAQAIHKIGSRKKKPFVQLNCAALNESLLESELFGHVKGAFTGAFRHRIGRFEAANHGDIFLDEIGETPLSIQVKLLRTLELNQIERVGDHQTIDVDVRLITATNKNLRALIKAGKFREDFFFRINVIPIHIPPLRERKEDIPLLVDYLIKLLRKKTRKRITTISAESMQLFMDYHWPGNIRELKSALEFAFVVTEEGKIENTHLPAQFHQMDSSVNQPFHREIKNQNEKEELLTALQQSNGNQSQAAKLLNISRVTVWNRMKKYGIDLKKNIQSG